MINTELEKIVSLALDAYLNADGDRNNRVSISDFELQFRRLLMQKYCNTIPTPKQHTYTINAGEGAMGKWTTRDCPPNTWNVNTTTKQILNG